MDPKIVITHAGAVSCLGTGPDTMAAALLAPPKTIAVKDFEFHALPEARQAFAIGGFDPEAILGKKGLRTKDRATKLLMSAIELGFKGLFEPAPDGRRPGLCIGTAFGSVASIGDFLSDAIVNGSHNVNPQAFANTVINSPASNANIRYAARTLSSTVSTTFNAGLDALVYAAMFLRRGYEQCLVAGGLEEISYYGFVGLERSGLLSAQGTLQPFAKDGGGTVAGEGCAVFCVETGESAKARDAAPLAEIVGIASCFDPKRGVSGFNPNGDGARRAMKQACADAGVPLSEVGFVAASANGVAAADSMEADALAELLPATPVAAYKAKTGECIGASPCLSLACALSDMKHARISGTGSRYPLCREINLVVDTRNGVSAEYALINSFSCDGYCGSILLKNGN
jgi:3-oxoacyl-(acyl-carrier-protein) synthase